MAVVSKLNLIDKPFAWLHLGTSHWDEPNACLCQNAGLIISTILGLVAKQSRALWQYNRQFVQRCQIMKGSRQQLKADWYARRRADQMQTRS